MQRQRSTTTSQHWPLRFQFGTVEPWVVTARAAGGWRFVYTLWHILKAAWTAIEKSSGAYRKNQLRIKTCFCYDSSVRPQVTNSCWIRPTLSYECVR